MSEESKTYELRATVEDALRKRVAELESALQKIATAHVPLYASEAYLIQIANDALAASREGER